MREKFWDSQSTDESLVKHKSNYTPKVNDPDLTKIIEQLEKAEPTPIVERDNLTPIERVSLEELKSNNNIIIKEADKGGTLVIMDKEMYYEKLVMEPHLNTNAYSIAHPNVNNKVIKNLKLLMDTHRSCLTEKEYAYITKFDWKTSNFYALPKVHKCIAIIQEIETATSSYIQMKMPEHLASRPIIAGPKAPTQHLSELLDILLSPLVMYLKSYIKDDWDFLRKLPRKIPDDCDIYTCDITSLYTNINHELGLKALSFWVNKLRHLIPVRFTTEFILDSASFILKNNYFAFNNVIYQQMIGTAMGTIFAPPYACLSVGFLEVTKMYPQFILHIPQPYTDLITNFFLRYMDDGIVPWPKSIAINVLENILNSMDPNIKYTLEPAKKCIDKNNRVTQKSNFLDITVTVHHDGSLETDIFYKETNAHNYLDYTSHHPEHIKKNIPYNLAKRIIVFCSSSEVMNYRLNELKMWLSDCNYPKAIIDKAFHSAKLQGPAPKPLPNQNVLPLVTTYASNYSCHNISKLSNVLLRNSNSNRVEEVFKNTSTINALKQPPNILRQLSQAKFNLVPVTRPPGLHKCNNPACILCKLYIQECQSFFGSNNIQWEIKSSITCHSKNVIYFLKCLACNFMTTNVGQTTNFRQRMNNHISDSRTGRTTDIFDLHVFKCTKDNAFLLEPFFQIYAFMEISDESKLLEYEKMLHRRGFDTLNN